MDEIDRPEAGGAAQDAAKARLEAARANRKKHPATKSRAAAAGLAIVATVGIIGSLQVAEQVAADQVSEQPGTVAEDSSVPVAEPVGVLTGSATDTTDALVAEPDEDTTTTTEAPTTTQPSAASSASSASSTSPSSAPTPSTTAPSTTTTTAKKATTTTTTTKSSIGGSATTSSSSSSSAKTSARSTAS